MSKAMDEAGLYDHAHRFLHFAMNVRIRMVRFSVAFFPDGANGSTWRPRRYLQIDQTATVIAATWHHFERGAAPMCCSSPVAGWSRAPPTF